MTVRLIQHGRNFGLGLGLGILPLRRYVHVQICILLMPVSKLRNNYQLIIIIICTIITGSGMVAIYLWTHNQVGWLGLRIVIWHLVCLYPIIN